MAFNPNLQSLFYTDLPEGEWIITGDDDPEISEDSWDTKNLILTGIFPGVERIAELFGMVPDSNPTGWIGYRPIAEEDFWVQRVRFKCYNGAIWQAVCECKGLATATKATAIKVTFGSDQQQAENVSTPIGLVAKLRTLVPTMQFERVYLHQGPLDFSNVGHEVVPPLDAPDPPTNVWSMVTDGEVRYPRNLVLMAREPQYLTGVSPEEACLVRDLYTYIFALVP